MIETILQPVRGCGRRKSFGMYLESATGAPDGVLEIFTVLDPPIPISRGPHRGFLVVDGSKVLEGKPEQEWYKGNSKDTIEKKRADAWALDTFGMTMTKRMSLGECAQSSSAQEAYDILERKVKFTSGLRVALEEAQGKQIYKVAPAPFASLVQNLQVYQASKAKANLVKAAACVWQIMETLPPSKQQDYKRLCMFLLASLGLALDSLALGRLYNV